MSCLPRGATLTADADLVVGETDGTVVVEYAVPPFTVEADASVEDGSQKS